MQSLRSHRHALKRLSLLLMVCGSWVAYWVGTQVLGPISPSSPYWLYSRLGMALLAPFLIVGTALVINRILE